MKSPALRLSVNILLGRAISLNFFARPADFYEFAVSNTHIVQIQVQHAPAAQFRILFPDQSQP